MAEKNVSGFEASRMVRGLEQEEKESPEWREQENITRREESWKEVDAGKSRKCTYAEKIRQETKGRLVNTHERERENVERIRQKNNREIEKNRVRRVQVNNDGRKTDGRRERKEYEQREVNTEEEKSTAELALEKVEVLHKIINMMEGKIKKLDNLVENMLQTHNTQMERIIKLITEMKEEGKNKGKAERERRKIIEYNTDDDEFF